MPAMTREMFLASSLNVLLSTCWNKPLDGSSLRHGVFMSLVTYVRYLKVKVKGINMTKQSNQLLPQVGPSKSNSSKTEILERVSQKWKNEKAKCKNVCAVSCCMSWNVHKEKCIQIHVGILQRGFRTVHSSCSKSYFVVDVKFKLTKSIMFTKKVFFVRTQQSWSYICGKNVYLWSKLMGHFCP